MKYKFTDEEKLYFIEVCQNSKTMSEAAYKLNMHMNTFMRYAKNLVAINQIKAEKIQKRILTVFQQKIFYKVNIQLIKRIN